MQGQPETHQKLLSLSLVLEFSMSRVPPQRALLLSGCRKQYAGGKKCQRRVAGTYLQQWALSLRKSDSNVNGSFDEFLSAKNLMFLGSR